MFTAAGFPVPTTVRDVSEHYLMWGLARREETPDGTRWSVPAALPLPGDLLPLDADLTKRLEWIRWTTRTGPLVNGLIEYLVDDLGEPQRYSPFWTAWRLPPRRCRRCPHRLCGTR
ncbi:DUF6042 family protein [Streptomyces angustmyceticus]|uniref:DUF6042 family protein n=1 Tax=Streptomyces angustmyceticus TaxID=285578 RepID=UPI0015823420|nr:DUF6042 family protein [Streptomyces angustmyceticus]